MRSPTPPITPAKVVVSLLLLAVALLTLGLFLVPLGSIAFWGMLGGLAVMGAAAMLIPIDTNRK